MNMEKMEVVKMEREKVTVYTKKGGVVLGELDSNGRLIWMAGRWLPFNNPPIVDRELRKDVEKIVRDGGKRYFEELEGVM